MRVIDQVWRAAVGRSIDILCVRERRCKQFSWMQALSLILFRKWLALPHHAPCFLSKALPLILGISVWRQNHYATRSFQGGLPDGD